MTSNLDELDWKSLLRRIDQGKCTPFLGAGVSHPPLYLGGEIAKMWAREYDYPLPESNDLPRVAQFLAVKRHDDVFPKDEIADFLFRESKFPDFGSANEPHSVLASLPFPIYITTNYDDFMFQALSVGGKKIPTMELCRWNSFTKELKDERFVSPDDVSPTVAKPVVYYLHGHKSYPRSFVLTEDDYLDFLINIARYDDVVSDAVKAALKFNSLLFIGYSLRDLDFRVMYRGLVYTKDKSERQISVTVQLPYDQQPRAADYLEEYFRGIDCKVYWGTAKDFVTELSERWKASPHGT